VSWYQKGKTNLDFTEARDSEWQWNQLCQHPTTPFFTGRMPFLPPNQQRQSTEVINESFFGLIIHIQKSRQTNTDMYENNGYFSRCYKITGMMNKPCHYQCSFM